MAISVEKREAIIASYKEKKILLDKMQRVVSKVIDGESESNACMTEQLRVTTWRRFLDSTWQFTDEDKNEMNQVILNEINFWQDLFLQELFETTDIYVLDDFQKSYDYAMSTLRDREVTVLQKRFVEGLTLEKIGQEMGNLTRERIRQIIEGAMLKIRRDRLCVEKFLYGYDYTEKRVELLDIATKQQHNDALLHSIQASDTENTNKLKDALLTKPLEELHLSERSSNCMKKVEITTVGELYKLTYNDLINIKNLGKISVAELKSKMNSLGLLNWPEY